MMTLHEKTILVTGGTGSFGQKFAEIVSKKYKVMLDTDTLAVNKKGNKI